MYCVRPRTHRFGRGRFARLTLAVLSTGADRRTTSPPEDSRRARTVCAHYNAPVAVDLAPDDERQLWRYLYGGQFVGAARGKLFDFIQARGWNAQERAQAIKRAHDRARFESPNGFTNKAGA